MKGGAKPDATILSAIGWTPLVRLSRLVPASGAAVWAKCEFLNPGGSAKDRVAVRLVEAAERDGRLMPGGTVVEASSGNMAIGLAQVCAVRGYRCIIVADEKMSQEKRRVLEALGARLVLPSARDPLQEHRATAYEIASATPGAVFIDQFTAVAGPVVHYETTGAEIIAQLPEPVAAVVASVGTGDTLLGVGRRMRERDPDVRIVCAEPAGGILAGPPRPHRIEGAGPPFLQPALDASFIDEVVTVEEDDAFAWVRRLAREEGILAGGSSGVAVAAAVRIAAALPPHANVVAILADTGRNYLSKLCDDEWVAKGSGVHLRVPAAMP